MGEINIKGQDKAEVLAILFNHSRPLGMGAFNPRAHEPMSVEDAREVLEQGKKDRGEYWASFDYLHGRVMKLDLKGDTFDPYLYDRDNGPGAAERALRRANLITEEDTANA